LREADVTSEQELLEDAREFNQSALGTIYDRYSPAIALILAFTLAVGGSGAAVVASQDALPNDPLYAVKLLSEDVCVNLTTDGSTRANMLLNLAERRTDEIVATGGASGSVLARQQAQITSALQIAAGLNDAQMNQVLTRTRDMLEQGLQTMGATSALSDARTVLATERELEQIPYGFTV
jgi:hypothetical protein